MKGFGLLAVALLALGVVGCAREEGPGERAGKNIDRAVGDAADAVEDAGDDIEDAVRDNKR
ncbi:MAG: hypothetical protein IT290_13085 [Deltaproteobacteria bacterium]|nr:hypothetical protein [Deltaproteobacteria bacterium]